MTLPGAPAAELLIRPRSPIPRWVLKVGATARSQPYRPPMRRSVEDGPRSADDVEFCGVIGDNALES